MDRGKGKIAVHKPDLVRIALQQPVKSLAVELLAVRTLVIAELDDRDRGIVRAELGIVI